MTDDDDPFADDDEEEEQNKSNARSGVTPGSMMDLQDEDDDEDEDPTASARKAGGGAALLTGDDVQDEDDEEDEEDEQKRRIKGEEDMSDVGAVSTATSSKRRSRWGSTTAASDDAAHASYEDENQEYVESDTDELLLSTIITPSPFVHHNSSDRYRNSLGRIQSDPLGDVEAWQALLTEAQSSYRTQILSTMKRIQATKSLPAHSMAPSQLFELRSLEADSDRKLDWMESCYGALLHHFPYAAASYIPLIEMLLMRSTLPYEQQQLDPLELQDASATINAPVMMSLATRAAQLHPRQQQRPNQRRAEKKLDAIFRRVLGVNMDGTPSKDVTWKPFEQFEKETHEEQPTLKQGDVEMEKADEDASATTVVHLGGMCSSSVEIWLQYVRKRGRDAQRSAADILAAAAHATAIPGEDDPRVVAEGAAADRIRTWTSEAFETALQNGAAYATNNHVIWKQYVTFVKSWTAASSDALQIDHALHQKQLQSLRSVYQRLIALPLTGLDGMWMEYEQFEKAQNEQLATALIAELLPKYQHARSIYLERNRTYNIHELRVGRLPVPPADPPDDTTTGSAGVGKTTSTGTGVDGDGEDGDSGPAGTASTMGGGADADHAGGAAGRKAGSTTVGGATAQSTVTWNDYLVRVGEECTTLSKWKRRCGYERTNPERLQTNGEVSVRVRHAFRDAACAFMRHPEVWHDWAMWELLHSSGSASSASSRRGADGAASASTDGNNPLSSGAGNLKTQNVAYALAVLSLGQRHIPDSSLLAYAQAQIVERYFDGGAQNKSSSSSPKKNPARCTPGTACIKVLNEFCRRAGNSLSFVLLERAVRKYNGPKESRQVFARARRILRTHPSDVFAADVASGPAAVASADKGAKPDEGKGGAGGGDGEGDAASAARNATSSFDAEISQSLRHMVTNRLGDSVGNAPLTKRLQPKTKKGTIESGSAAVSGKEKTADLKEELDAMVVPPGFITWHLYACHACIERRQNSSPTVAARVYELGLRRHRTFLRTPAYVMQYASLLLELNDEENLRALLSRAVAACEEAAPTPPDVNDISTLSSSEQSQLRARREAQRPLWDLMLLFESILSTRSGDMRAVQAVESRRRRALYGPHRDDVVAGGTGLGDSSDGFTKSSTSIQESLLRSDGYDVCSRIVNGMGRLVEGLEVGGAIGDGTPLGVSDVLVSGGAGDALLSLSPTSSKFWRQEAAAGSRSDTSYHRRLQYQREEATRKAMGSMGATPLSSMAAGATAGAVGAGGGTAAGRLQSARERFMSQQQQQQQQVGTAGGTSSAGVADTIGQNIPEWLRGLVTLLPPPPRLYRGAAAAKPPPHMIEMALIALRENEPPRTRPEDEPGKGASSLSRGGALTAAIPRKRGRFEAGGGDDSDDEDGGGRFQNVSGYGGQFRARQRARAMGATNFSDGGS